jgi:hypothetical protein
METLDESYDWTCSLNEAGWSIIVFVCHDDVGSMSFEYNSVRYCSIVLTVCTVSSLSSAYCSICEYTAAHGLENVCLLDELLHACVPVGALRFALFSVAGAASCVTNTVVQ